MYYVIQPIYDILSGSLWYNSQICLCVLIYSIIEIFVLYCSIQNSRYNTGNHVSMLDSTLYKPSL